MGRVRRRPEDGSVYEVPSSRTYSRRPVRAVVSACADSALNFTCRGYCILGLRPKRRRPNERGAHARRTDSLSVADSSTWSDQRDEGDTHGAVGIRQDAHIDDRRFKVKTGPLSRPRSPPSQGSQRAATRSAVPYKMGGEGSERRRDCCDRYRTTRQGGEAVQDDGEERCMVSIQVII